MAVLLFQNIVVFFFLFFRRRLKDEITMTLLIRRVMKYLEDHDAPPSMLCRVYLRYIDHIYYKVGHKRWADVPQAHLQ